MNKTYFEDLGKIDYKEAWNYQQLTLNNIVKQKENDSKILTDNKLLFCEHNPVYTLGKNGAENNLLINSLQLKEKKIDYFHIDRGGDVTYHGPGQITGYPILNLDNFDYSLREYISNLEESFIWLLNEYYGIKADRKYGATGVWIDPFDDRKSRKICAIGVKCTRWVTMHGFAFNVNTDLSYFSFINPCGFTSRQVTSLEKELGEKQDFEKVKQFVKRAVGKHLKLNFS